MKYIDEEEKEEEDDEGNKNDALDNTWMQEFETNDMLYQNYYLDDLYNIKIHCIYLDACCNIVNVKEDRFFLKRVNILFKEELIGLLKKNSQFQKDTYKIQTILKYNITLQPKDIQHFLTHSPDNYLNTVNHIDDVHFMPSISMFQDLNELYFIFIEKTNSNHSNDSTHKNNNVTKRIILRRSNKKKTRRSK